MDTLSHTVFTRRFVLRSAAGAGLAVAAVLPPALRAGPAKASNYRAIVGDMYATYEKLIAYLASQKCNVIAIEGAPPFMLLGPAREAEMVDGWKRKYNTDMFTSSQNQVNAFKALKAKRILGITSGSGGPDMNKVYAKYFEDAGIGVVAMEGMGVEFKSIPDVPPATIASFIKKAFAEHEGADAVYILGSSLEALPLIAPLERELGVPTIAAAESGFHPDLVHFCRVMAVQHLAAIGGVADMPLTSSICRA